ncbi:XdhC family protein [Brevibacterium epidermidis]|uniref:XdhC family protein n=1 Tax=Brevibacterium epidermidis TaxID=1698 RepID=UPI001F536803|nr:XdhC family protein [Brevibacterium epidermidis]
MLDVLSAAATRLFDSQEPQDVAVATIIATEVSVPRPAGTSMLVDTAGGIVGSLTGGCVEGAVLEACQDALATGEASVQEFGYSDEEAFPSDSCAVAASTCSSSPSAQAVPVCDRTVDRQPW